MIIQNVVKGIAGLSEQDVDQIFASGIQSNWLRYYGVPALNDIPKRLTARNLDWHQNRYDEPDPMHGNAPFSDNTPFISTTAGLVERDRVAKTNTVNPAKLEALRFATDWGKSDGWIFDCYLFVLGRPAVAMQQFSEELRELHVYTGYSPYQPEGEITAKLYIPPTQIRRAEFYRAADVARGRLTPAVAPKICSWFERPERFHNIRGYL